MTISLRFVFQFQWHFFRVGDNIWIVLEQKRKHLPLALSVFRSLYHMACFSGFHFNQHDIFLMAQGGSLVPTNQNYSRSVKRHTLWSRGVVVCLAGHRKLINSWSIFFCIELSTSYFPRFNLHFDSKLRSFPNRCCPFPIALHRNCSYTRQTRWYIKHLFIEGIPLTTSHHKAFPVPSLQIE